VDVYPPHEPIHSIKEFRVHIIAIVGKRWRLSCLRAEPLDRENCQLNRAEEGKTSRPFLRYDIC
jgi:hypothetical protein